MSRESLNDLARISDDRQGVEKTIKSRLIKANRVARVSAAIAAFSTFGAIEKEKIALAGVSIPAISAALFSRSRTSKAIKSDIDGYAARKLVTRSPYFREVVTVQDKALKVSTVYDHRSKPLEGPTMLTLYKGNHSLGLGLQQVGAYGTGLIAGVVTKGMENGRLADPEIADPVINVLIVPATVSVLALVAGTIIETTKFQMSPYQNQLDNIDGPTSLNVS